MKKFTKAIATFCAMAMIVSVFSATVFAEDGQGVEEQGQPDEVQTVEEPAFEEPEAEEPEAGESVADPEQEQKAPATRSGSISIDQAYITNNEGKMPEAAGTYTLTEDIIVTTGAKIETQDAEVTINLNGHTITYTGTESMYVLGKVRGTAGDNAVPGGAQTPVDILITGVVLTINGEGTITGAGTTGTGSVDFWINGTGVGIDKDTGRGGCVLIENGCKMVLNGGVITGFEAKDEGGAICVSNGAEFVMNGGEITNCTANNGGGAISGQASSAAQGPNGINIVAKVTINGGYIHGNEATVGGGIRIRRASFYLNGGTITDNNAKANTNSNGGGGIAIDKNSNKIDNVPVAEVKIQGTPKVYDNKAKGSTSADRANLFLNDAVFTLSGALSSEANLYFSVKSTNNVVDIININGQSYDISSIKCDRANYVAIVNSGKIAIKYALPKVEGYSLKIGGEILLTTTVSLGMYADANTSVSYAYSYTKNGGAPIECGGTVAFSKLKKSGSNYTFDIPVESACMTAPIVITITYSDGTVTGQEVTVEQYAHYIIEKGKTQTQKDIAEALLIYGGYAQVQFNINTNMLPSINNIDFASSTANYGLQKAAYTAITDPDRAFAGAKLSMLSQTEIKLYFKKSVLGDTAPEMTVSYSSDPIEATPSGSYYIYVIKGPNGNGFSATQYDQTFTFTVGSVSGTYSVETYLKAAKNTSTNQAMLNLAEAYYNFAEKCQAL